MADIDIDFADRDLILNKIQHIPARQVDSRPHISGVYVTQIPQDHVNGCAAIDYKQAEDRNYFKIDFLNVNVYKSIKNPEHYQLMLSRSPDWNQLSDRGFCSKIVHIGNHWKALAELPEPVDSIPRMAAFISIIRPGKAHLQGLHWRKIFPEVWNGDSSRGYCFKKSHAVSYAKLIALHINLIQTSDQSD